MPGKIVSAVVILLALAAVVGVGAWMAGRHYQPTIDRLNEALTQCRDTGRRQSATIASQNAGIEALRRAEAEREAKAKAAQEKARREAQGDYSMANEVLSERTTGEVCAAASAAFDAELRRERAR
ncbi:YdgA family protein [Serratia quinivorans]|uniref:YdgA family protein n=1 Tax=Serratia quinivorans TaxID=137545 RepID=UPI001C46F2AF|nr:YdgA family protein [Serratia quinivorans]MBV6691203.1 YdgA family protein [Serratia quinivorans]